MSVRRLVLPLWSRRYAAVSSKSYLHAWSATLPLFEKRKVALPTLGDSITEGTIVEWTAVVGQGIQEGDVIAMVETDKVTIEIKSDFSGVITQQFAALDDTIEVGADLYELDTEGVATVTAPSSSETESAAESSAPPTPSTETTQEEVAASSDGKSHRTPLIQFLGKEGWKNRRAGTTTSSSASDIAAAASTPVSPTKVTSVAGIIPPSYGRPKFSEEEMEALILGGANTAPDVLAFSEGAKFG